HSLPITSGPSSPLRRSLSVTSFFFSIPPPPRSTLFPYTTLFRSQPHWRRRLDARSGGARRAGVAARPVGDLGRGIRADPQRQLRSEEHTSELQSLAYLVCRLLLEKKKNTMTNGLRLFCYSQSLSW